MTLPAHEAHHDLGATFTELVGSEAVAHYGDSQREFQYLNDTVGVLDVSFRTRLVLVGNDRIQFLHSQCTNDIKRLRVGEGCYTAITNNKGRMEGDANVLVLANEVLLDAEPGQTAAMSERFERFIVSEDVEVVDASPHYGLLTVQGPRSVDVMQSLGLDVALPTETYHSVKCDVPVLGELYVVNHARLRTSGFDLFAPIQALGVLLDKLITATRNVGGGLAGWEAFERARIMAGIPRFGADMTEKHLAPEAGIELRAISYQKGCYIGQEVLNRLRTFAEVKRRLCQLLVFPGESPSPAPGVAILNEGKAIGSLTSIAAIGDQACPALGYVRKELLEPGQIFELESGGKVEQLGPVR